MISEEKRRALAMNTAQNYVRACGPNNISEIAVALIHLFSACESGLVAAIGPEGTIEIIEAAIEALREYKSPTPKAPHDN